MLPTDELFSDGKLMPLLLLLVKPSLNELFVFFVRDQKKKKKKTLDFAGIQSGLARITVEDILEKKKSKVVTCVARNHCSVSHSSFD
jgi:hypothetical protein